MKRKLIAATLTSFLLLMACGCNKLDKKPKATDQIQAPVFTVVPDTGNKKDQNNVSNAKLQVSLPKGQKFPDREKLNPGTYTAETIVLKLSEKISMELVWIPAGTFMMGNNLTRDEMISRFLRNYTFEHYEDEYPAHKVTITKGYWIGKYEVTQEQWKWIMGYNPSLHTGSKNPVDSVCWFDAVKFTEVMKTWGIADFRLPTEAEWEYAARAGSTDPFYWGMLYCPGYAWDLARSERKTHPVGLLKPNNWGLYDITGNVHELCFDSYDRNFYEKSPAIDPVCTSDEEYRVVRGGWYTSMDKWARIPIRGTCKADFPWCGRGFRIIVSPY